MIINQRTYAIVPFADTTQSMLSSCLQDDKDYLRRSASGVDRVILCWDGNEPDGFSGYTKYTHEEVLAMISDKNGEWHIALDTPSQP